RRPPAEGERRLISAIAASPEPPRASRKRPTLDRRLRERKLHQPLQPLAGGARVERLPREPEPLAEIAGQPSRRDGAGCVEQDRAPPAAVRAGEDVADREGILGRASAAELLGSAPWDTQL